MACYLARTGILAGLATASMVVPDQQALIQSNMHVHHDLLPPTAGAFDQGWLMELLARVTSSVIMMLLAFSLARRFGSVQDEDKDLKLDKPPQDELRPFWWAVEMGDTELLGSILDADPALAHHVDEDGRSALHVAALNDASDSLQLLLQREMDVNMPDARGETALHLAAGAGHLCSLIILLDAGAVHDQKNAAGCTALDSILAQWGADQESAAGRTALGKARAAGETAARDLLLEHGGVQLAFGQ